MNEQPSTTKEHVIHAASKVKHVVRPMRQMELAQETRLKNLGVSYEIKEYPLLNPETGEPELNENGEQIMRRSIVITAIPDHVREVNNFFIDSQPCWFPGCEGLRAQYKQDLEKLGGADCPSCKAGALHARYHDLVDAAIKRSKASTHATTTINTGSGAVAGSAQGRAEGVIARPSVLRRAANHIAKVFGFGKGT